MAVKAENWTWLRIWQGLYVKRFSLKWAHKCGFCFNFKFLNGRYFGTWWASKLKIKQAEHLVRTLCIGSFFEIGSKNMVFLSIWNFCSCVKKNDRHLKHDGRRSWKLNLAEHFVRTLCITNFIQIGSKIWFIFEFEILKWPPFWNKMAVKAKRWIWLSIW